MKDGEVAGLTAAELAEFRPAREVLSPEQFAAVTGRGRPRVEDPKQSVTIRLDRNVVEAFKATGKGWQTRMNEVLAKSAGYGVTMGGKVTTPATRKSTAASVRRKGSKVA